MVSTTNLPHTNRLLDTLPEEERDPFFVDCEIVDLEPGQILTEPGERISHVYFPIDCVVSLIVGLESGARLEVSMAGKEAMVGIALILGAQRSSLQVIVQGAGPALRMPAACFLDHLDRSPVLERRMRRYLNVLISQISQSAACAHFHEVTPRLARRLLMTHDRTQGDQLSLTQEFLSSMLGVRRAGVTLAAKVLQTRGLIDYQRGSIIVNCRHGLEKASCRCYADGWEMYGQSLNRPRDCRNSG